MSCHLSASVASKSACVTVSSSNDWFSMYTRQMAARIARRRRASGRRMTSSHSARLRAGLDATYNERTYIMLTLSYPGAALASECGRATRAIVRCAHPRITSPLLARRLGARSAAAAASRAARDALVAALEAAAAAAAVGLGGLRVACRTHLARFEPVGAEHRTGGGQTLRNGPSATADPWGRPPQRA